MPIYVEIFVRAAIGIVALAVIINLLLNLKWRLSLTELDPRRRDSSKYVFGSLTGWGCVMIIVGACLPNWLLEQRVVIWSLTGAVVVPMVATAVVGIIASGLNPDNYCDIDD